MFALVLWSLSPQAVTVESLAQAGVTASSGDNDFTRLNNALLAAPSGETITLVGRFDISEPFAREAWRASSPGIIPNYDVNNVTLRAAALGDATIHGPGDDPDFSQEGFLYFPCSINHDWVIENLIIEEFDSPILMSYGGCTSGHTTDYANTRIQNNIFRIPADINGITAPSDPGQNIGLLLSIGTNQKVLGNRFEIDGTGISDPSAIPGRGGPSRSSTVAIQTNSTTSSAMDGLEMSDNVFIVKGTPHTVPANIMGLWDNSDDVNSDMLYARNRFEVEVRGGMQRAFVVTTQSGTSTTAVWEDNIIINAQRGFVWLDFYNQVHYAPNPTILRRNTCIDVGTCIEVTQDGKAQIENLVCIGGDIGVLVGPTGPTGPSTDASSVTVRDSSFFDQSVAAIRLDQQSTLDADGGNAFQGQPLAIQVRVPKTAVATHTAKRNIWGGDIASLIFDINDDMSLGEVLFADAEPAPGPVDNITLSKRAMLTIALPTGYVASLPQTGTLSVGTHQVVTQVTYARQSAAADSFTFYALVGPARSPLATVTLTNEAPTISGSPATSVNVGSAYAFTPTAADVNEDALTFSATGLPAWLTLNTSNGALAGTPPADATDAAITLSVSDGALTTALASFSIDVLTPATPAPIVPDEMPVEETPVEEIRGSGCRCSNAAGPDLLMLVLVASEMLRRRRAWAQRQRYSA